MLTELLGFEQFQHSTLTQSHFPLVVSAGQAIIFKWLVSPCEILQNCLFCTMPQAKLCKSSDGPQIYLR